MYIRRINMPLPPPFGKHGELPEKELVRQVRGLAIVSIGSTIKRINKLTYKLKSQSSEDVWYDVIRTYGKQSSHQEGEWTCTCPDFLYRKIVCKHVYAVGFSKELRRRIVQQDVVHSPQLPIASQSVECPKCKLSDMVVKDGRRLNKCGAIQKYLCRSCNYRFIVNIGFEHSKKNPRIITLAIDLYFKGVSLRKIADHVKQFHDVKVDHTSVLDWIHRFADEVAPFVDKLTPPHLGGVLHVDEMMVNVRREKLDRGHYQWLWNLMDKLLEYLKNRHLHAMASFKDIDTNNDEQVIIKFEPAALRDQFEFATFGELKKAAKDSEAKTAVLTIWQGIEPLTKKIGWKSKMKIGKDIEFAIYEALEKEHISNDENRDNSSPGLPT